MQQVDWPLATKLADTVSGELPSVTRPEVNQYVAQLRLAGQRGGQLAQELAALAGAPTDQITVTDRRGWHRAASAMAQRVLAGLTIPQSRTFGVAQGYGAVVGVGLAIIGRRLLGQFDGFAPAPKLYLLAPNIYQLQHRQGFTPADFQLWVAVHEQTHALQFSAAPWLGDYLQRRFSIVAEEESGPALVSLLRPGGESETKRALDELTATMTFLEGHADLVTHRVGKRHIPSARKLIRAFHRPAPTRLARLAPGLDKGSQYRRGLEFAKAVQQRVRMPGLAMALSEPSALPSPQEIAEPERWLERVHGTS